MKSAVSRLLWIPICVIMGYLLLTAVFLIPGAGIHGHIMTSFQRLTAEGDYPVDPFSSRKLDNFTDAAMLLISDFPTAEQSLTRIQGTPLPSATDTLDEPDSHYRHSMSTAESAFVQAANSSYIILKNTDVWTTVKAISQANPRDYTVYHDNRYWHGHQVFLRPLLLILNIHGIRIVNAVALFSLILFLLFQLYRKARPAFLPFVLSLLLLAPTAIAQSLQYSGVTHVALIAMLALLRHPDQLQNNQRTDLIFLFSGIATAFWDLLTAPTITLTFPLALLCLLTSEKPLRRLFRCILFWGLGYAGMWLGQWIIAWIVNGQSFLQSLIDTIHSRSGNTAGIYHFTRSSMVLKNLLHMLNNPYLDAAIGLYGIGALVYAFLKRPRGARFSLRNLLPLLVIPLIPLAWLFLLANHAWFHTAFTYRNVVPCVFCILCMPAFLFASQGKMADVN